MTGLCEFGCGEFHRLCQGTCPSAWAAKRAEAVAALDRVCEDEPEEPCAFPGSDVCGFCDTRERARKARLAAAGLCRTCGEPETYDPLGGMSCVHACCYG